MILVHHLRIGRSVFAVWLLEELGVEYELKIYDRNEMGRAPPELREAHPLGKSPVIVDGDLTLAESGAITSYLVDHYDTKGLLAPPREDKAAHAIWTQWLHYPEGSAFAPLLIRMLASREQDPLPTMIAAFSRSEVALQLDYIDDTLGDKPFLLGDKFQAPDVGVAFIVNLADRLGELGDRPNLKNYRDRMLSRPAFLRAMERTGG